MRNLNKYIMSLLALIWTVLGFIVFLLIGLGLFVTENSITILIINMISNPIFLILGYYFGSSEQFKTSENLKHGTK